MISVLEQLNSLLSAHGGDGDLEKSASLLAKRQNELTEASPEKFALVIYDGERMHRKFPVETETDIRLSKQILAKIASRLPDEVVATAEYFIDLASRELCKVGAYETAPSPASSNVIYAGHINTYAWHDKLAKSAVRENDLIAGFRVQTPMHVRSLSEALPRMAIPKMEMAEAGIALMKRAHAMDMQVSNRAIARFDRRSIPAGFVEQVQYRKSLAPPVLGEFFDELMKEASAADTPEKLLEVAKCVEYLDMYSGFTPAYGETRTFSKLGFETPDPVDLVFPEAEELANDEDYAALLQYFGEEFMQQYAQNPEEAMQSLSPAERYALQSLLSGA